MCQALQGLHCKRLQHFIVHIQCVYLTGLRLPIYKTLPSKAPVLPAGLETNEPKPPEIDVSDLGSRNYAARTDFYCLVSEDDI